MAPSIEELEEMRRKLIAAERDMKIDLVIKEEEKTN